MKNILTVVKKEFARFFRDRRLVIGTLLLPAVLIFALYSLLGSVFYEEDEHYTARVVHPSALFAALAGAAQGAEGEAGEEAAPLFALQEAAEADIPAAKEAVLAGECDLLIVFPENFDALLAGGVLPAPAAEASSALSAPATDAAPGAAETPAAPNVEIWYDSGSSSSVAAYNAAYSLLDGLEDSLSGLFDVNMSSGGSLVSQAEAEASYYAMLLPFLILTFLYSGCMGLAPESVAGEKERGTIATLLVTPIRRGELVVGKIVSLAALSTLSAVSSFVGTFLAMPQMMGGSIGQTIAAYSVWEYLALFAVMVSAVLLIVTLISMVSSYARSVKEATSLAVPLMVVVMLVGISTMLFTVPSAAHAVFLIPLYNCVQVMAEIFSLRFSPVNLLITLASNLVYIALLVWLLTKMFQSERVIFNR